MGNNKPKDPREILYRNFIPEPMSGCWIWTGFCFPRGYGSYKCKALHPISMKASRASWIIHNGKIENGLFVLHTCDNTSCVNPDHLYLGTHKDNMDDCRKRNRFSQGDKHSKLVKENTPRGNKVFGSKLNEDKVKEIRSLADSGYKYVDIARTYKISPTTCRRIAIRQIWRHVA